MISQKCAVTDVVAAISSAELTEIRQPVLLLRNGCWPSRAFAEDWSGSASGQGCCDLKMSNTYNRLQNRHSARSRLSNLMERSTNPKSTERSAGTAAEATCSTSFSRACCTLSCSARFRSCKEARIFSSQASSLKAPQARHPNLCSANARLMRSKHLSKFMPPTKSGMASRTCNEHNIMRAPPPPLPRKHERNSSGRKPADRRIRGKVAGGPGRSAL